MVARAYSNVFWKNITFEANLVFTRGFNFLGGKLASPQTLQKVWLACVSYSSYDLDQNLCPHSMMQNMLGNNGLVFIVNVFFHGGDATRWIVGEKALALTSGAI